jgi:hypothetical protein
MTQNVFKSIFFGMLAVLLMGNGFSAQAAGPEREFVKNINREFSTSAKGMTALYNRNGKIVVKTWDQNKVKIDISIVVNANNQETADKIFDRIKVNFANTSGYVKAETVILEDKSGWNKKGNDYKINYEVWMPAGNKLDLKNKYGDNYVDKLDGKLTAEIKYGNIRAEAINNDVDLMLGYGEASIAHAGNLFGQLSYSELQVEEAGDIQLDTKYSELKIQQAKSVRITSRYDDFNFGSIGELRLQTKYADVRIKDAKSAFLTAQYTDIELGNLSNLLDADLTYGDLEIARLGRNFKEVTLTTKYADVVVHTEEGCAYQFNTTGQHSDLAVPSGATIKSKNQNGSQKAIVGYVGNPNAAGVVKATMNYGELVIK